MKYFIVVLILALNVSTSVLATVNCPTGTTENVDCWSCGVTCTAVLDQTGQMTISGEGEMTYWMQEEDVPWHDKRANIKNIIISDQITTIGARAFSFTDLSNVSIPDSVTYIGTMAFYNSNISDIHFGNQLEIIDYGAFSDCSNLHVVEFPDSLNRIDSYAFAGVTLTSVDLGNGLEKIKKRAFENVIALAIPNTVTEIDPEAFKYGSLKVLYCDSSQEQQALCAAAIEGSGLQGQCTLKSYFKDEEGNLIVGQRKYASLEDLANGKHILKRIYTIDEANAVAKPTGNTVRIKYR